jgi:carbon monoxide dehydrogenase subunit G
MELEHSFTVPVSVARAWDVLLDVERVAPCMPGASLDSVDGDEIKGRIKVKVGPISMTYAGTATFTERDRSAGAVTLEATGKETRGAGTASATVRSVLTDTGGQTQVSVHTTLNVTGKPAQFGRGVLAEVGGKLIGIFADNLAAMLAADSGGNPGDTAQSDSAGDQAAAEAGATDRTDNDREAPAAASADMSRPIDELNLPVRAWNSLRRDGIQTVGDLVRRTPQQLLAMENIGPASVAEIRRKLADHGLALAGAPADVTAAGGWAADDEEGNEAPLAGHADDDRAAPASDAAHGGTAHDDRRAARANGTRPAWQPDDDAIDLLDVAGIPVLKRALPVLGGVLAAALLVIGIRRRRRRR